MLDKKEFQQQLRKIEEFVSAIEKAADPNLRASAIGLLQTLMDLHGAGIERVMEIVFDSGQSGREIIDRLGQDDIVSSLLLLYGLHPLDLEARVLQALEKVRPYLRSHAGDVEIASIDDGAVRLRLQGSCNGCASSAMTMKTAIEEAVYEFAPDVTSLEVEGVADEPATSGLVQLKKAPGSNGDRQSDVRWEEVSRITSNHF